MPFDTFNNGAATELRLSTGIFKIARALTFPDIEDRDAPGKTGSAAKPALVTSVGLYLAATSSSRLFTLGLWSSGGTNFSGGTRTIPDNTNTLKTVTTSRPVFARTNYLVGGFVNNPVGTFNPITGRIDYDASYSFGAITDATKTISTESGTRYPLTSSTPNFTATGTIASRDLAYEIAYNVLPTAPLTPVATQSGPFVYDIELTWDEVSSDGGTPVTGYKIDRSSDGVTWATIVANSGSISRTYTDANLALGATFYYRIAAINAVATAHGADYSGPYSVVVSETLTNAEAGNALSLLTATVDNPEPAPLEFSDSGAGIQFTQIAVQYGSEYLYNEVQATTKDSFAVPQIAEASNSKQLYGVRSYGVNSLLNTDDSGALAVARNLLTYYYEPELRVESIIVDLSNLTLQQKLQVIALEIDDYIKVTFTPNGVGDPKVSAGLVTGISHRVTLNTYEVELRLRNERKLFTTNSDNKGILNQNRLGP